MDRSGWIYILTVYIALSTVEAYRFYQDRVPNGDNVPHPCKPNYLWRGLGHLNPLGAGERNLFGIDFALEHMWNENLCRMDSDGDGMTNGQELGDPDCKWKPGILPSRSIDITHPGICDPWGSAKCKESNEQVSCDTGEFNCDAINAPGVKNFTIRFPKTKVPAVETTYMCMKFDIPDDDVYHLIAIKPYLDNVDIMHHIVVTACADWVPLHDEPKTCFMAEDGCSGIIGTWGVGTAGRCYHPDTGFKIGTPGRRRVSMQFHWTNPEQRSDLTDSSGVTIYYTPNLRKYNAGTVTIGETKLFIPPGQPKVTVKSTCKKSCTDRMIDNSIYLTSANNHMHYLGYRANIALYRDGKKVQDLANDEVYSYDSPQFHQFDVPVKMRQGDELVTTCTYRSVSKPKTTTYGEGSFDEMCFGLLIIYPQENFTGEGCTTYGDFDQCEVKDGIYQGCNIGNFQNETHPDTKQIFDLILDNCNHYGICFMECPAAVAKARQHPCLQGDLGNFHLERLARSTNVRKVQFAAALTSCARHDGFESPTVSMPPLGGSSNKAASFLTTSTVFVIARLY